MKATNVTDLNIKYVDLPRGKYLIDGEVVDAQGKIVVKSFDNIRKITQTTVVSHYVCGTMRKEVSDYNAEKLRLESKREEEDGHYEWASLEDEFAYRKFIQDWTPVTTVVEEISEPLSFGEILNVKVDTGCPYIQSEFSLGNDTDLYVYHQGSAWAGITDEVFKELGMEFTAGLNYNQTANKKIWSNSTHSGIRYVTAFNTYVFDDTFKTPFNRRGTLKECMALYEADKKRIKERIVDKYKEHFGRAGNIDHQLLLKTLRTALNLLKPDDFKKSGTLTYRTLIATVNDAIRQVKNSYETEHGN